MTSKEAFVALNLLDQIGPIRARRLLEGFDRPECILGAKREQLERVPGIGPETAHSIVSWESQINLAQELTDCERLNCRIIAQDDPDYPANLLQIYDPPLVLYVRGTLEWRDQSGIAVVGSRRSTPYGKESARRLSVQLARAGVTVVSGGARGIDSSAHFGALDAKGRTLCVLGNGMNLVYPPENHNLFEQIRESGALLTEFPLNRPPDRRSFPIRNRIVAGMTLGTVVVKASLESGALITANLANDYGRQVFALPGSIQSPQSKGCHRLIKEGAKLCETSEDILSEFEYLFPESETRAHSPRIRDLNDSESKVFRMIQRQPMHIDEIVRESELSIAGVSLTLLQLEMKGFVFQQPGHLYHPMG